MQGTNILTYLKCECVIGAVHVQVSTEMRKEVRLLTPKILL